MTTASIIPNGNAIAKPEKEKKNMYILCILI